MQIRRRLVCVYGWHLTLIGSLFLEIAFLNSPDCHSCAWWRVWGMKATGRVSFSGKQDPVRMNLDDLPLNVLTNLSLERVQNKTRGSI